MGGVFGGDSSVIWKVHADRVRSTKTSSAGKAHNQEGIDETDAKGFFTVTIKLPRDRTERDDFIAQLSDFITNPKGPLIVRLPIEDKWYLNASRGTTDQIRVDWPK